MQYTNILTLLLTAPALLPLVLAAPAPLHAGSLSQSTLSDTNGPLAAEAQFQKRQIALGDEIAQPPTPNTDTNPPPPQPQQPGNGHATPGNGGTGPGTNTNDGGLTPEQRRQQGNRIQAGIAHDDTH